MIDSITLSTATHSGLQALQNASQVRADSARKLASGLAVEKAVDNPSSFFQAKSLTDRVSDLASIKDNIGQGLSVVEGALNGVDALTDIAKQMKGVALSARGGTEEQRAAASEQYNMLRNQLGELAKDVSYQGTELLSSTPDTLSVPVSTNPDSSISIAGSASDANGLGIASSEGFTSDTSIDDAISNVNDAISTLNSQAAGFGSEVALLNTRQEFTTNISNTLSQGAAKLTQADLHEEAARELSGNVRQRLAMADMQIASKAQKLIVEMLQQ